MSYIDLFSEKAALYASARPRYPDQLFSFVVDNAPAHRRAWDCGTGNGQAATSLARHFGEVCASDPSSDQIVQAVSTPNVIYSVQPAEQTTFPECHFDAICVAQALHWFNFDSFFVEVGRVSTPGAVFVAWGYDWFIVSPKFDSTFKSVFLDIISSYWAPQNQLVWNGYIDVPLPFARIATPSVQIRVHWNLIQLLSYVNTWSATRRCIARIGQDFTSTAERELIKIWGRPDTEREIVMPLHVIAGRIS